MQLGVRATEQHIRAKYCSAGDGGGNGDDAISRM